MARLEVLINTDEGLHARPASEFVRLAASARGMVRISRPGGAQVDGKSMLGVLSLGFKKGERAVIEVLSTDDLGLLEQLAAVVKDASNH